MPSRFRLLFALAILTTFAGHSRAQVSEVAGLNALPQVEFTQLSQQDRTPLGAKALAIHPLDWRHAETEHFIYHFQRSFVATSVSVEAEFYFRVVSKALGKSDLPWPDKAHIYIFETPADWESFRAAGELETWTGGLQSGGSLFIVRNPAYKFTNNSLGHEVTHLVLFRFYGHGIPRWLNEGFAQYASKGARASFRRARGYNAKPVSSKIEREKLFPLSALTTMNYPSGGDDQVTTFYDESERLVKFLVVTDKEKFSEFLTLSAAGQPFDVALFHTNGGTFASVAALEEKFFEYAAEDAEANPHDH